MSVQHPSSYTLPSNQDVCTWQFPSLCVGQAITSQNGRKLATRMLNFAEDQSCPVRLSPTMVPCQCK